MIRAKSLRQRNILAEIGKNPALRVTELAKKLDVSAETIRRDLDEMTEQGLVSRVYGGAVRVGAAEPSLNERHTLLVPEREAIARAAVERLGASSRLLIGCGATTVHVARRIAVARAEATVLTNAFGVATVLALNPRIAVLMVPGYYHAGEGAMIGAPAANFLARHRADWAILGASGLSSEGPSDALDGPAAVFEAMAHRADRTMIVADSSKFDSRFAARWAAWSEIDVLVSERAPQGGLAAALAQNGVDVIVARGGRPNLSV